MIRTLQKAARGVPAALQSSWLPCQTFRQLSCSTRDDGGALSLLSRYHEGHPMSPAEKHLVRSELLRAPRAQPSLADLVARLDARLGRRVDDADVVAETSKLLARPDLDKKRRKDLTKLHTVTIDSESTVEIDDGLSAEPAGEHLVRVFVHVADPTRFIFPDDPLASVAKERVRTIYLPHAKKPMLPLALGAERCSLHEGVDVPSLTVTAIVRLDDGSIVDDSMDILLSVTRSSARMTYGAVDDIIHAIERGGSPSDKASPLSLLFAAGRARKRWRTPRTAVEQLYRGSSIAAGDAETIMTACPTTNKVTIDRTSSSDSPSKELVMELMVLAGDVFATLGRTNSIPLPYRSQEVPAIAEDKVMPQPGPALGHHLRRYLLKSTLDASPALPCHRYTHAALGIPNYVQTTSPIRRYVDILAHWQMKAHLRGDVLPYDVASLQTAISALENSNKQLIAAERAIDHAWLCAYVANKGPHHTWTDCTLVHWLNQERGRGIVFVPELGREVVATINRPAPIGCSEIRCVTTIADPFTGSLSFTSE